jgi:hypothetical protein
MSARNRKNPPTKDRRKYKYRTRVPKTLSDPNSHVITVPILDDVRMLATGASNLATTISVSPSSTVTEIFGGLSQAYRFFKVNWAVVMITPISSVAGSTMFFWDNTSSTVPTNSDSTGAVGELLTNNSAAASRISCKGYKFTGYTMFAPFPHSQTIVSGSSPVSYFAWISTLITGTPMYLKVYTDNGSYGSPISTNLWTYRVLYSVSFKTQNS